MDQTTVCIAWTAHSTKKKGNTENVSKGYKCIRTNSYYNQFHEEMSSKAGNWVYGIKLRNAFPKADESIDQRYP